MLNRRQLLGGAAAVLVEKWSYALGDTASSYPRARYDRAIVIDALGGLGEFNPGAADAAPLSARALADARESGVTVVNLTVNSVGNGPNKFIESVKNIAATEHEFATHPDLLMKILRGSDIQAAKSTKRLGIVYGCQDTTMLEGDLKNLAVFADLGVRIVQPTYNLRNLMGDGCIEKADGGLSELGYEFVAQMNRLNLLLDLSHAGPRTIAEGIAASKAPMAITHTGCRTLVDLPRNTRDSELRALAERGGVVGIYHAIPARIRAAACRGSDPSHRTRGQYLRRGSRRTRHGRLDFRSAAHGRISRGLSQRGRGANQGRRIRTRRERECTDHRAGIQRSAALQSLGRGSVAPRLAGKSHR
jgi:membrane dipeptidase